MAEENKKISHRDDDEIYNRPVFENKYDLTVQLCNMVITQELGNDIIYEETKDFENSTFPIRKLTVTLFDKELLHIMNAKKDENGLIDVTVLVSFDKNSNVLQNKPFEDGKFKGLIQNGDFDIPLNEVSNDNSVTKSNDNIAGRLVTVFLFRESELNCFDDDNINFLISDINLKNLLLYTFDKFAKPFKFIISDPDHNPNIKNLLIPQSNLIDLLSLLDTDMGIYKTNYMFFLNEGVIYFLNTDNDFKCRNTDLEFSVNILVNKDGLEMKPKTVDKLSNGNFTVVVEGSNVNVERNDRYKVNSSINYIFPNGSKYKTKNMLSRNVTTVRKITNVQPLEKYRNISREDITIVMHNIGMNRFNPLSTIFYADSLNIRRQYRVSKYQMRLVSRKTIMTKVKAFRLIEGGK